MRAIAYSRVSTDEQAESGLSLDAQAAATHRAITRRGWKFAGNVVDVGVPESVPPDRRKAMGPALESLDRGDADALVAVRLDRITRSVRTLAEMVERSRRRGWLLVAVAENFDLSTGSGEIAARILTVVAQNERDRVGAHTREAMAAARARGVRLGRPSEHLPETRLLVMRAHLAGCTLQEIADRLTEDQVPTPRGGRWHPATVRRILVSLRLDYEARQAADRLASQAQAAPSGTQAQPSDPP